MFVWSKSGVLSVVVFKYTLHKFRKKQCYAKCFNLGDSVQFLFLFPKFTINDVYHVSELTWPLCLAVGLLPYLCPGLFHAPI